MLNDRSNIVVLVDEAHRTQEGDLGRRMRRALPNALLFGLTGTPINRAACAGTCTTRASALSANASRRCGGSTSRACWSASTS